MTAGGGITNFSTLEVDGPVTATEFIGAGDIALGTPGVFFARNYGDVTWDSTHDVGPAIIAAITAAQAYGGGTVMVPAGVYGLATPIVQNLSGIHIVGAGVGTPRDTLQPNNFLAITRLRWIGAADATMLTVEPASLSVASLRSTDVRGITFDGASLAAICAKISQTSHSVIDIGVSEPRSIGAYFTTTTTTDAPGVQDNDIWVEARSTDPAYSPTGILIDAGNGSNWNVSYNRFQRLFAWYNKGDGIVFGNSDNNVIIDLRTFPQPGATGSPVIFATAGYVMPNGLATNTNSGQPARTQRVLHVGSQVTVQGFSATMSITAGGGNTGTVSFAAISIATSGSTAFGTTTVVLATTTGIAAGMLVNAGDPSSGIANNSAVAAIPSAGTLRMDTPTVGVVAGGTTCSFSPGFTRTARAGTYTITATGASTFNITAPSGGTNQTGVSASGGVLAFTDLVLPISGSAVSGDTWTVVAPNPCIGISLEFVDKDNSVPTPHFMAGAAGWISTSTNMLMQQANGAVGISLLFSSEVNNGFSPLTPGARAVVIGNPGANGATGESSTVLNGVGNIASGFGSSALGGHNLLVSGNWAGAVGEGGTLSGNASFGVGSNYTDRSEETFVRASGSISTIGDVQVREGVFYGRANANSGRLTLRGTTPSVQNGFGIATGTVYKITIRGVVATETGNRANWAAWYQGQGVLHRESGNAAYVGDYSSPTTPNQSGGAASTATLTIGADTTFQTLSVTVTWPNGNNVNCTMDASTVEVH